MLSLSAFAVLRRTEVLLDPPELRTRQAEA